MPDTTTLLSLANGSGLVAICLLAVICFVKGWIVPGYLFERSERRNEKLADQVDQTTKALAASLDRLTDEVRARDRVGN